VRDAVLKGDPSPGENDPSPALRRLAHVVCTLPEFQLA